MDDKNRHIDKYTAARVREDWKEGQFDSAAYAALVSHRMSVLMTHYPYVHNMDIVEHAIRLGITIGLFTARMKGGSADEFIAKFEEEILRSDLHRKRA